MTAVSSSFARFLRGFSLTLVRVALLPRGIYRFGYSPPTLSEGRHRRGRVAQGYQGPLLPYRVRTIVSSPCTLLLTCISRPRHMGLSVVQQSRGDIDKVINSLRDSLQEARASKQ
jgi:hypothetical protein